MWVMTTKGFFSAVSDNLDPDGIVVRARAREDIKALAKIVPSKPKPIANAGTDYPWRIYITRAEWTQAMVELSQAVDYGNFKDAVEDRQGKERADVYHDVWAALLGLERHFRRPLSRDFWQGEEADLDKWFKRADTLTPKKRKRGRRR